MGSFTLCFTGCRIYLFIDDSIRWLRKDYSDTVTNLSKYYESADNVGAYTERGRIIVQAWRRTSRMYCRTNDHIQHLLYCVVV